MGSQIPSHHTDVAAAMGAGDSFLLIRLKFGKLFTRPTRLKACICNCAKSSKTAAISPMIKPPKNRFLALRNIEKNWIAYRKLECLKIKTALNHFALKHPLLLRANLAAMAELRAWRVQPAG